MLIVNYGVSKHYAGSMVSDRCLLGDRCTSGYLLNQSIAVPFHNTLRVAIHTRQIMAVDIQQEITSLIGY